MKSFIIWKKEKIEIREVSILMTLMPVPLKDFSWYAKNNNENWL